MLIGLDARPLHNPSLAKRGIGRVITQLINLLQEIDPENNYLIFTEKPPIFPLNLYSPNFKLKLIPKPAWTEKLLHSSRWFWTQIWDHFCFPIEMVRCGVQLGHFFDNRAPLLKPFPTVVMIHDLLLYHYQKEYLYHPFFRWKYFLGLKGATQADLIQSDSEYSSQELQKHLRISSKKIRVVPLGVDSKEFYPEKNKNIQNQICSKYNIRKPFILYSSGIDARKNIPALFKAFAILRRKVRPPLSSVIVAAIEAEVSLSEYHQLRQLADQLGISADVIYTGFIPNQDLRVLYNSASVFVYPSKLEGFGLPLLEAMSCGTPTVAANSSALPETAGGAALLFDPEDHLTLAKIIQALLQNKELQAEIREKGFKRAAQFSWRKTAEITLNIYNSLNGQNMKK